MRKFPLIALGALAATLTANAAVINLVNQGFETGDLTGWVSTGDVQATGPRSVVTFDDIVWDVGPNGLFMAAMNSNGEVATALDAFFGLPFGTLQNLNLEGSFPDPSTGGALTNGSGIYQDFMGNAGDTVTMYYNYVARDYIQFNDPAFGVLVGPTGFEAVTIASIWGGGVEVGTSGNSGWRAITFTLQETGMHRLGFAVTNDDDTILDAALFLDVEPGTSESGGVAPGETPEFPILPDSNPLGGPFEFTDPTPGLWYDPPFAEAYTYTLFGGAEFIEFATPPPGFGFGDLLFTDLTGANASFVAMAGVKYAILPTSSFKISGIPNFAIDFQDPNFAIAFPAFLDWTGTATKLQIDITPHPDAIPEPSTYALLGVGLAVLAYRRFRA
ncbi:MAG: PEP-CTERM sorting domain-containing protein [Bryobacteraceae bacterium]|nr:PEP-CTERM sorting domain-containing protein [Bryobacteraceae bacterium]